MNWTKEKPTKEGWYWYTEGKKRPVIAEVNVVEIDDNHNEKLYAIIWGEYDTDILSHPNGQWLGPLEVPEGPE